MISEKLHVDSEMSHLIKDLQGGKLVLLHLAIICVYNSSHYLIYKWFEDPIISLATYLEQL